MPMRSANGPGPRNNMDMPDSGRRNLIGIAGTLLLLGLAGPALAQAPACFDLDALPASQKGMRRSIGFKPVSPDPARKCATCSFFTPSGGDCGKCALLSGGAVATGSVCDNWAAMG
jgi:hypothetical protein